MYHFFALAARMRMIGRWSLMNNHFPENVAEHTLMTAIFAHALALISRDLNGDAAPDPNLCAAAALFHDAAEILTGDMPTPVKYFNQDISKAYHAVEEAGIEKLLSMLPEGLRREYRGLMVLEDGKVARFVAAADKLSAYVKCVEELRSGNAEFGDAARSARKKLEDMDMPELKTFFEDFIPSFSLTLDELT